MPIMLQSDCDCASCGVTLFTGELAHRDNATGIVACCREHLQDAIEEKKDFDLIALFNHNFEENGIVFA